MLLLKEQKIEKENLSYRDALKEAEFVQFFNPRSTYFMFLKHEHLMSFDECIKAVMPSIAHPAFESKHYGAISEAKTTEMTLKEAVEFSSKHFLIEIKGIQKTYKNYPSLSALVLKLRSKEYLTKEVFNKYNETLTKLNDLFSNPDKVLSLYKEMFPEIDRDFILDNNTVSKAKNPLSDETKFYSIESNGFKIEMSEYDISCFYLSEEYSKDNSITFNITYELTTPSKHNTYLTLELKSKDGVEGFYLQGQGIELFMDKKDAIKRLTEINKENKKYLDLL